MEMKSMHLVALGFALSAVACGGAASTQWDPQSAAALHAEPEALLRDLDAGNVSDMLARMDDQSVVLDLDENNHPVRVEGRAKVTEYLGGLEKAMKKDGVHFRSKIAKNDCTASASFGYCIVEFDQTISAGGQTMGPFKLQATLVARKVGDTWRWSHWHGSFREMPAPAPAAASTAALK
jgi:SnoaL-like domain